MVLWCGAISTFWFHSNRMNHKSKCIVNDALWEYYCMQKVMPKEKKTTNLIWTQWRVEQMSVRLCVCVVSTTWHKLKLSAWNSKYFLIQFYKASLISSFIFIFFWKCNNGWWQAVRLGFVAITITFFFYLWCTWRQCNIFVCWWSVGLLAKKY